MRRCLLFALVLCFALSACEESGPSAPGSTDLSRYSGVWVGVATVTQVGECSFGGEPRDVTMDWVVTEDGQLTISERQWAADWSGEISPTLRVSVTKADTALCFGSPNGYSADYQGRIQRVGANYEVALEALETPCPPDCTFRVVYSLTRQ